MATSQWRSLSTTLSSWHLAGASSAPSGHCTVTEAPSERHTLTCAPCRREQCPLLALHCHRGALRASHSHLCAMQAPAVPPLGTAKSQSCSVSVTLASLCHTGASRALCGHCTIKVSSQSSTISTCACRQQQCPLWALHRHGVALRAPHSHLCAMQAPAVPPNGHCTVTVAPSEHHTLIFVPCKRQQCPLMGTALSPWRPQSTTLSSLCHASASSAPQWALHCHRGTLRAPHAHLCVMQAPAVPPNGHCSVTVAPSEHHTLIFVPCKRQQCPLMGTALSPWRPQSTTLSSLCHASASSAP